MKYVVYVEDLRGNVDDYDVVEHYFEAGFLHLAHQLGPMSSKRRYTTSIPAHNIRVVTTADER
jgi:hypothetical protein